MEWHSSVLPPEQPLAIYLHSVQKKYPHKSITKKHCSRKLKSTLYKELFEQQNSDLDTLTVEALEIVMHMCCDAPFCNCIGTTVA